MNLVQILLPLQDAGGHPSPRQSYDAIREELTRTFGGVTEYARAPAEGLWKDEQGRVSADRIVIFEVMIDELDPEWWHGYRRALERAFRQQEIVVRAIAMTVL